MSDSEPMFRREFLKLMLGSASMVFSACGAKPTRVAVIPIFRESPTPESNTIEGSLSSDMGFKYSDFIKDNNLIASVPKDGDSVETLITMTTDYLRRYVEALADKPELRGKPVVNFGINTSENLPIAIFPEWTTWDVVNTLKKEIDEGRIAITYDLNFDGNMGVINDFHQDKTSGNWTRVSKIVFGKPLAGFGSFSEANNRSYRRMTDLEMFVSLVHEYGHVLQDEASLQLFVNADSQKKIFTNADVIRTIENKALMGNKIVSDRIGVDVRVNEAQATALGYSVLVNILELNATDSFPGTRQVDPLEVDVHELQQLYSDYMNLFSGWKLISNAADPSWLGYFKE